MASTSSEPAVPYLAPGVTTSVKIVVLGPFAVGKTTFVSSVSEITPLSTEALMTERSQGVDELLGTTNKTTTTTAMDFGRLTLDEEIVLYIFGAPGQSRFSRFIDGLMVGALGGVAMVDTRHIDESFESLTRLEKARVPYVVAVNCFPEAPSYSEPDLREAFDIAENTPLITCDARYRESAKQPLIALVSHLLYLNSMGAHP
ncbi:ATP/GTP-binding protein [Streptomyces solisilvae]|uniref:GTP-binding protein n=1 Tax=Streptomyces malaysiensis TaxID=92644 RepID=UPI003680A171